MVQYVTHTGRYTVLLQKKIEELFTLSPELPLLADLVFWLYFIVSQVAMCYSSSSRFQNLWHKAVHWQKKINILQLF